MPRAIMRTNPTAIIAETNQCVVITSVFYIPRAVGYFKKAGVECIPFPVHYLQEDHEF